MARPRKKSDSPRPRKTGRQSASPRTAIRDITQSLDAIAEGIQILDPRFRYLYVNQAAAAHGNRTKDQLIGKSMLEEYPGIERTEMFAVLRRCMEERTSAHIENEFAHADGTVNWFDLLMEPVDHGLLVISIDITERKQLDTQLRHQAALLDIVPDAILVLDLDGCPTFANRSSDILYGRGALSRPGTNARSLFIDSSEFDRITEETLAAGYWEGEIGQRGAEGKEIIVFSRRLLMRDDKGNPHAVLVVNSDVTTRKSLEQQFLRSQRMESLGTLASGITHDLNNVLSPIMLSVDMLRAKVTDPLLGTIVDAIDRSSRRGAELIRQVLSFARGVDGVRRPFHLRDVVRELTMIIGETFPKAIALHTHIPDSLPQVIADETQIHQVLMNLCVNARDAMPSGGTLEIAAEEVTLDEQYARMNIESTPGRYVCLTVADDGIGMPAEVRERVFEPFYTTKESTKGTGLGLSTVMTIVKSHRGFVNIYSEAGKGSTFRVYLPIEGNEEPGERLDVEGETAGNGERILVVDDEPAIREITQRTLEASGYLATAVADGTEAIAYVADHRGEIALVITDMMMPVMDGEVTIKALRKMDPSLRFLAVGGLRLTARQKEVIGPIPFLQKPYTSGTLLKAIAAALRAS